MFLDKFIDNGTEIKNNPSDYYDITNVIRSVFNAEEEAFLQSDGDAFLNEDAEARNYCPYSEDEKADDFCDVKNFRNLKIP